MLRYRALHFVECAGHRGQPVRFSSAKACAALRLRPLPVGRGVYLARWAFFWFSGRGASFGSRTAMRTTTLMTPPFFTIHFHDIRPAFTGRIVLNCHTEYSADDVLMISSLSV